MAEVAGVVLGGIPIALLALEKYHGPVKSYWKYDTTLSTLRNNIFVQQQQLRVTLSLIGLEQASIDEVRERLEEKYPHQQEEFLSIIGAMDTITSSLLHKLEVDINGKPLWTDEAPGRVQWEWRRIKRSFNVKERKALIDELQYWNTALKNCFEKPEVPAEDEDTKVQELQASFNPKYCHSIRVNVQAIHGALKESWNCPCQCSHHATIGLDWQSAEPNLNSVFDIALSFRDSPIQEASAEHSWRKFQVKIASTESGNIVPVTLPVPSQQSPEATPRTPSPISRMSKAWHSLRHPQNATDSIKIPVASCVDTAESGIPYQHSTNDKISCLCAEVRKPSKASAALGVLPDPDQQEERKFCLSHASDTKPHIVRPMPLKSLLPEQQSNPEYQLPPHLALSAKQRYGFAAAVAWAVLHLSCTPWLCDTWDREQIKVFLESTTTSPVTVSRTPCISYLFETPVTASHLDTAGRFNSHHIRNKTLFSLGILLIELCLNKSFEEFRPPNPAGSTTTSIPDDFRIAESKIDEVYNQAGDSYGYAVQRCLRCEFPGRDVTKNLDFSTFRRHFYNNVVAPLQATYLRYPTSCAVV